MRLLPIAALLLLFGCGDEAKNRKIADEIEQRVARRVSEGFSEFLDRTEARMDKLGENKRLKITTYVEVEDKPESDE